MRLAECHPSRKHQARGMCKSCYDKWLKAQNPEYKDRQFSNATVWARNNPDKMAVIVARRKAKEKADPAFAARQRDRTIKRKYGISQIEYEAMFKKQKGRCAICHREPGEKPLHIDHCHKTGVVRGLLCHQCNWYLGTIEADHHLWARLSKYVATAKSIKTNNPRR